MNGLTPSQARPSISTAEVTRPLEDLVRECGSIDPELTEVAERMVRLKEEVRLIKAHQQSVQERDRAGEISKEELERTSRELKEKMQIINTETAEVRSAFSAKLALIPNGAVLFHGEYEAVSQALGRLVTPKEFFQELDGTEIEIQAGRITGLSIDFARIWPSAERLQPILERGYTTVTVRNTPAGEVRITGVMDGKLLSDPPCAEINIDKDAFKPGQIVHFSKLGDDLSLPLLKPTEEIAVNLAELSKIKFHANDMSSIEQNRIRDFKNIHDFKKEIGNFSEPLINTMKELDLDPNLDLRPYLSEIKKRIGDEFFEKNESFNQFDDPKTGIGKHATLMQIMELLDKSGFDPNKVSLDPNPQTNSSKSRNPDPKERTTGEQVEPGDLSQPLIDLDKLDSKEGA